MDNSVYLLLRFSVTGARVWQSLDRSQVPHWAIEITVTNNQARSCSRDSLDWPLMRKYNKKIIPDHQILVKQFIFTRTNG